MAMTINSYQLVDNDTKVELDRIEAAGVGDALNKFARRCGHPHWASLKSACPDVSSEIEVRQVSWK
jgi:hypothetical protein